LTNVSIDSFASANNCTNIFTSCSKLKYISIGQLGTNTTFTSIDFSPTIWGTGDTDEEKATNVQSIVDTLLTNSFDRASAGYSTCTIKLRTATKALLTTEQLAAITAKGYTIA
jgi:hypothetical protein